MGIAVAVVLLGYLTLSALVLAAVLPLVRAMKLVSTKRGERWALGLTGLGLLWPLWIALGTFGYFELRCATASGVHISQPIAATAIRVHELGISNDAYIEANRINCRYSCSSLGQLFYGSKPPSGAGKARIIETRVGDHEKGPIAQFWVAKDGEEACIAKLHGGEAGTCIAGKVVDAFSTEYELVLAPFEVCEGKRCWKTSQRSDFLVKRYENTVRRGAETVARVVAFQRGSPESFGGWATCPFEPRAYGTWTGHFMKQLYPDS